MLAEFIFTPSESKLLIAKAVARMDKVRNAFENGILAIHPSSSTYYLSTELTGSPHNRAVWVTGTVVPKGFCSDIHTGAGEGKLTKALADPGKYPHTIVYYKGEQQTWTIYELLEKMGPGDVYIKGVNAVDANYTTGVLLGSMVDGTIGLMNKARMEKGYEIFVPVGLEKMIPGSVRDACKFIDRQKDYTMGARCRMFALEADVTVTEIEALEILSGGGKAVVFSAGGLKFAEGAVSVAFEGTEEQCQAAIEVSESVKGVILPEVINPKCATCQAPTCNFCGKEKHWITE